MPRHVIRNFIALLLLSGSLGAAATDKGGAAADSPVAGTTEERTDARDTRRGPMLGDAAGVVHVITGDEIRRAGADPIRSVPGMDVVGASEGSTRPR